MVIDRFLFSLIVNAIIIQCNIIAYTFDNSSHYLYNDPQNIIHWQINLMIAASKWSIHSYVQKVIPECSDSFSFWRVLSTHLLSSSQPVLILRAQTICTSVICTSATLVASCLVLDFTTCTASSCSSWCHRCPLSQTVLVSCWDSLSHCNHSHAIQAWHNWMKRQLNTSLCSGFVSKCWGWR